MLRWYAVLVVLTASVRAEVSWPECPCKLSPDHQPCTRVLPRQLQDNTHDVNINLQNCNIREITDADFPYPNAKWIDLRSNYIQRIGAGAFKHLTSVKYLSLEYNEIRGNRINRKAFQDCSQLTGIGLSGNDMREAADDLVEGLNKLEELYLVDTLISEVPTFVKRASNLTFLLLSHNKITLHDPDTFSSLKYLKTLHLDHNRIGYIPEYIFRSTPHIQALYLDYNKITYIPDNLFSGLSNLKYLRLQNNVIQYVSQSAFRDCTRLEELNLSNNRITQLSENVLPRQNPPKRFYFSGNPLECEYLSKLLNKVTERQMVHVTIANGEVTQYVCYKCLDFAFTDATGVAASPPKVTNDSVGQWTYTVLNYCHQATSIDKCGHD